MRAAVLGHPVAHSLSPALHAAAYRALGLDDWEYGRHDVDAAGLEAFLSDVDRGWAGLSLTMPLKHRALELVDHVDPLAAAVGAVNTVLVSPAGPAGDTAGGVTLTGTNTDVYGLVQALREGLAARPPAPEVTRAVVLGGGATAASALAALGELGCTSARVLVRSLDRVGELRAAIARMGVTPELVEADLTGADGRVAGELAAADVVVSTLPPRAADPLAAVLGSAPRGVLLDVAYDPRPTALHAAWASAGGTAVPGERMLLHQAVAQVRLMTGRDTSPAGVLAAMDAALATALDV
ncbi:shikimate dehydrogenase [Myceligenerans xiligouense]|uniref:Shikimate dehydrogenase n=1 Tax=Myceligenerans xiligouense TaxID=253184 RepID=A0A3N4ZP79_9MICO|nr:shikimate dehydrogenase [Myceligenerans xiligouense]